MRWAGCGGKRPAHLCSALLCCLLCFLIVPFARPPTVTNARPHLPPPFCAQALAAQRTMLRRCAVADFSSGCPHARADAASATAAAAAAAAHTAAESVYAAATAADAESAPSAADAVPGVCWAVFESVPGGRGARNASRVVRTAPARAVCPFSHAVVAGGRGVPGAGGRVHAGLP
eukprot:78973-Chlamydomonas_euryale.AAC.1